MEIEFSDKYEPLFQLLVARSIIEEQGAKAPVYYKKLAKVDTVLMSGGRDSGKSFAVSCFTAEASANYNHRILYTRQTMSSTDNSITSALDNRLEIMNLYDCFEYASSNYTSLKGSGKITITGQKTSAGTQTAKLKSLEDYSIFITDEAEETTSFEEWKKIKRSLRAQDVQCLSILIFNPMVYTHWIPTEFYQGVTDGYNGIIGNTLYIHTTYKDNGKKNMAAHNWNEYEAMRKDYEYYKGLDSEEKENVSKKIKKNHDDYKYTVLGCFKRKAEGVIYDNWEIGEFNESLPYLFGLDFGSNDPDALTKVSIDKSNKIIYIKEEYFKNNTNEDQLTKILVDRCGYNGLIVCDPNEPRIRKRLYEKGLNIKKAKKPKGSVAMGIKTIRSYTLIIDPKSINLIEALNNYVWHDKRADVPNHDFSHLPDSFRYAITDYLGIFDKIRFLS